MTRLVFLGPPGAGKGTQARALAAALRVPQIATGDMLREAAQAGTALGREARRYMEAGALVPDEVVIGLIAHSLAAAPAGFILDGFPRTLAQAESLDPLLKDQGQALDRVLLFEVSEAELFRRLTGRRACPACGATFHLVLAPPRVAGRCDRCGGPLVQRDDDREETVRARLAVWAEQSGPLVDYYRARHLLATVPGEGDPAAVGRAVRLAAELAP